MGTTEGKIMPNHIQNQITAPREVIDALTRQGDDGKTITDFAMVIPVPANIETGNCTRQHPEGVICWLDWNVENWGTKWNAYQTEIEQLDDGTAQLRFQTAWSHPHPVIEALSKRFPDTVIEVAYADEDFGANQGKYTITTGERTEEPTPEEYSEEAQDFATMLHYGKTYKELQAEWDAEQ